jgi:hypothetical protein
MWATLEQLAGNFLHPRAFGQPLLGGRMGDKKAAFATRSERALVLSIVREDLGDVAEKVSETLLRAEGLRLPEIAHKLQRQASSSSPSVHEVSG